MPIRPSMTARFATWVLTVLMVFGAGAGVVRTVGAFLWNDISLRTEVSVDKIEPAPTNAVPQRAQVWVRTYRTSGGEKALVAGLVALETVLIVAGLSLLRGIADSVRSRDPFEATNVRRLRRLGQLTLAGPVVAAFAHSSVMGQPS